MIEELIINNFAIIEKAHIQFEKGFNVITGETGAGKTVLINALAMVLGERADISKIRKGKQAEITAIIDIDENIIDELLSIDIEIENPLIIRRIIKKDGKSAAYINDIPVSLNILKKIGNILIDIHGQHEHQLLLNKKYQLNIIDSIAENEKLLYEYREYKNEYEKLLHTKESFENELNEFKKEKEYLEFAYKEIGKLELENIDEDDVNRRLYEMENAENIKVILEEVYVSAVENEDMSVYKMINSILYRLSSLKGNSSKLDNIIKLFNEIGIMIEDASLEIKNVQNAIYYDEEELGNLRNIVENIESVKKKYSMQINELIAYKNEIEQKLNFINSPEEKLLEISKKIEKIYNILIETGNIIYKKRQKAADKFSKNVNIVLKDLNMKDSSIVVNIEHNIKNIRSNGFDDLEFLLINKFNSKGLALRKIASGGELSRIMLAIKSTLQNNDIVKSMIFDEIDAGISGKTAEMVAKLMTQIAVNKQTIVITHLPQIAAVANAHFVVIKENNIAIKKLNNKEKIEEIARLLGSSISKQTAYKHAKALINKK